MLKNVFITTYYIDSLKNKMFKNDLMRAYIMELAKYDNYEAKGIRCWLIENKALSFSSLSDFKNGFHSLSEMEIEFLLKKFQSIRTKKIIFIHEQLSDSIILSNPSFTELISINSMKRYVKLLQFNIEVKHLHVQDIIMQEYAITKNELESIIMN